MNLRSGFLGHFAVLMSWTLLAQAISVGSMLMLPRLIAPAEFGTFAIFTGIIVMIGIVSAGRYEFAIGLPTSDEDGLAIFSLCLISASTVGLFLWISSLLLKESLPEALLTPDAIVEWWTWIGLGSAAIATYNAASYLSLRLSQFNTLGKSKALVSTATAIGQIFAAIWLTQQASALIIPFLVSQFFGVILILLSLPDRPKFIVDRSALRRVASRYIRFPKFVAPASFLDGLSVLLPVAVISVIFSPAEAGAYALAERTLRLPVTLVGSSISQAFYERASALRTDTKAAHSLLIQTWKNLALAGLLPCLCLAIWGEHLFETAFGSKWQSAGTIAQIMIFGVFFYFVGYPTNNLLIVNERVKSYMAWQIAQLLLYSAALIAAAWSTQRSLLTTVGLISGSQVLISLLSMVLQWKIFTSDKQAKS